MDRDVPSIPASTEEPLSREADRILAAAAAHGVTLRLTGSMAVWRDCPRYGHLLTALARRPYQDVDLVGRSQEHAAIEALFAALGYEPDPSLRGSHEYGIQRLIFHGPTKVDVFLDRMDMSHVVDFRGRLQLQSTTVSLVDLLLSKLQIHELTSNDIKDMAVLLAEHDLSDAGTAPADPGVIDVAYLLRRVRDDWGFWYTAIQNVQSLSAFLGSDAILPSDLRAQLESRVRRLRDLMERAPKTVRWRLRARVGPRLQWYQEVGDVER